MQSCHGVHVETEGHLLGTLFSPTLYLRQDSSVSAPELPIRALSQLLRFSRNAEITELDYTQLL